MLVDVLSGRDRRSARLRGTYHFARSPKPGEQVEIEGELLIVARAWHRPDIYFRGAKFAILVEHEDAGSEMVIPCNDDAVI
jgi:hypothetical protein